MKVEQLYTPHIASISGRCWSDTVTNNIETGRYYREAETDEARLAAIQEVEEFGSPTARSLAGALYLDFASRVQPDNRGELLDLAVVNLELGAHSATGFYTDESIARAGLLLNNFECYRELLTTSKNPPLWAIRKAYEENIFFGDRLVESIEMAKAVDAHQTIGELSGVLGELIITLVLQRFTVKQLKENTWCALPALYSDDHKELGPTGKSSAFDIAIHTQDDPDYHAYANYRIQSKTGCDDKAYAEEITVVRPRYDLALPLTGDKKRHKLPLRVVARECQLELLAELTGEQGPFDQSVSERLDQRTDNLLEILG